MSKGSCLLLMVVGVVVGILFGMIAKDVGNSLNFFVAAAFVAGVFLLLALLRRK